MPFVSLPGALTVPSAKKELIRKFKGGAFPKQFASNSRSEETVLEYVEHFRRQFVQLFPGRAPLLLTAVNESGTPKFVCNSVLVTRLPYIQNYDLQQCADFVSGFLNYLPLGSPTRFPDMLYSPNTLVKLNAGDCLDLSNFLVSLLRGYGFDAYVVAGFAEKWVTENDQTNQICPLPKATQASSDISAHDSGTAAETPTSRAALLNETKTSSDATEATAQVAEDGQAAGAGEPPVEASPQYQQVRRARYQLLQPLDHTSKFLEEQKRRDEAEAKAKEAAVPEQQSPEKKDPFAARRAHCWVLVKAGPREVKHDVFVEPSTGHIYPVESSPYVRVESLWNEKNYWVNVQSSPLQKLKWDLRDNTCWEWVIDSGYLERSGERGREDEQENEKEEAEKERTEEKKRNEPAATDGHLDTKAGHDTLDVGMSWCPRLDIDRDTYRLRYAGGIQRIEYKRCTVEKFAEYYAAGGGITLRLTLFADDERKDAVEIRETFAHRKDNLIQRNRYPAQNKVHEIFEPGRASGLKDFIEVKNERRFFEFYPSSRVDGMIKREEIIGVKVVEIFENRDDRLVYRSISIDTSNQAAKRQKGFAIAISGGDELYVRKITEKFAQDSSVPADEDVRKRTHLVTEGKIRLDFHFGEHKITSSRQIIDKSSEEMEAFPVDPNWQPPTRSQIRKKVQDLLLVEKALMSKVKDRERDVAELLSLLQRGRSHVVLQKSVYDVAVEHSKEMEDEQAANAAPKDNGVQMDYLSPFLAQFPQGKALTRKQALQAKDDCLKALKERLLERANIIQAHLDAENEKLKQKQAIYNRSLGAAGTAPEADDEFTKFYEETMFRISILQARLARHEEQSLQRYAELDQILREDPRLRILESK